jgi:hypothetical protein
MNYSKYRFTLDIQKTKSQVSIYVLSGDTKIKFYISINDGGTPYQITEGCVAKLVCRPPSGRAFLRDCEIEDNRIVYTFDENTASEVGVSTCEVRINDPHGGTLTTPRYLLVVEEKVLTDEEIEDYQEE